jgi:hypothetical protein
MYRGFHSEGGGMGWMVFPPDGEAYPLETLEARERLWLAQAELELREAKEVRPPPKEGA